jgi:hypothetical protein
VAYHGCNKDAAQALLSGSPFLESNKPYDWLGAGSYFWEEDPLRAYHWAQERRPDGPCVIGAVIDLGNCLDLTTQVGVRAVKSAYVSYSDLQRKSGNEIPKNQSAKNSRPDDLVLRLLDRAVVDHLHELYKQASKASQGKVKEFDTVRAMCPEGEPIYEDAGFLEKTHVQIAVKNMTQIRGVFRLPSYQLEALKIPDLYSF